MSEFEARPNRELLERLVTALSIRTASVREGGGGRPALETCHYAAMLAGMDADPWLQEVATHLLLYGLLHEPYHRKPLARALLTWMSNRILILHPDLQVSGSEVLQVISVGLDAYVAGGSVTIEDAGRAGIKRRRWERLRPVYSLMLERINEAEDLLVRHLSRACT